MAIKRASTSTALNGFPKYPSIWDQSTQTATFDYLGSATVGATVLDQIVFAGIPQTYTHLQLRGFAKTTRNYAGNNEDWLYCTINGDGGSHNGGRQIAGNGSSLDGTANISVSWAGSLISSSTFVTGQQYLFSPFIIDIFDYSSTTKFKTFVSFTGFDTNSTTYPSGSTVRYAGNSYKQFTPVTSLVLSNFVSFATGTTFALYGIK